MPNELDELIASHSQKCLDVTGWSTQEGNPIIQWQCHGGDNQAWSIEPVAEGYSRLVSRYSGQCLDVSGESTKDGAPIIQWACHGGANQQWRLETIGEGYRFVARHSGMCLDVTGGRLMMGSASVSGSVMAVRTRRGSYDFGKKRSSLDALRSIRGRCGAPSAPTV